jgi:hypothetical protein
MIFRVGFICVSFKIFVGLLHFYEENMGDIEEWETQGFLQRIIPHLSK